MTSQSFTSTAFRIFKRAAVLTVTAGLGACATSPYVERQQTRSMIIDGIDVYAVNTVLIRGFTEIKERAIDDPDVDTLFATAFNGLNAIDPAVQVTVSNGRVFIESIGQKPVEVGTAPRDNIPAWSELTIRAILMARKTSVPLHEAGEEEIYKVLFNAALNTLDSYSRYSSRQDAARNRLVRDGVIGLGVRIELVDDGAIVQSIVHGGPGELAGLKINDIITAADGVVLKRLPLPDIRRRLDGAEGTVVALTVIRPEHPDTLTILAPRELIVPDTVTSTMTNGVLELRVRSFNQRTARAVEKAVVTARQDNGGALKGITLDMRGDPGGLLDQAIDIADLFLEQGTIASLHGRHPGARQYYAARRGDISFGAPIAIVLDGKTASAAEIVASALQDNKRAAVVGTVSWGKGSVQTVIRLPNSGEIALTWARAVTPRGVELHGLGLLPDVCLSGEATSVGTVIGEMFEGTNPSADTRRVWRTAADDLTTHQALRAACPAEAHPDRAVDLEVARRIVSDPALLALAIPDNAAQLAVKP